MADDIVTRLRDNAFIAGWDNPFELLREAADELERLEFWKEYQDE